MNKTDTSENLRLRKELIHQRNVAADLQEELEEKTQLYIKAIQDRDEYKVKLGNAKESVSRVEQIVQSKLNLLMEKERKELDRLRSENQLLLSRIEIFDQEKLANQQREKTQQDKIMALTQDLQFYARNVDMRECMSKIDLLRAEKTGKDKEIVNLLQEINKKSNELENALAENRQLRGMVNVPQNFGINAEQIKFLDREKIDDYKKLIRVLQEDNYRLEEERAKLKHMLKQQSMLYKTDQPNLRYKNLSPEQLFKVDQFVLKLLAGETEEPADFYKLKKENQILKAQLDVLNTKGFDFAKAQIEAFLKELGLGDSGKFLEKLMSGNEELKKMLRELLAKGISLGGTGTGTIQTQALNPYGDFGKFRPPMPTVNVEGDIPSGFSYKFTTHLDVMDKDGRAGLSDQTKYDVAFLQLQLTEFIELLKRKDEDLNAKNNEIEHLYKKVRDYLLIQDQLYKDFVKQEKDYTTKRTDLENSLKAARDSLYQEQHKVKLLESSLQTLQKGDKQAIENRLIELTKQHAINDVNLLKLSRKYQILEEQEQILRREYHNKEADMAEKDRHVQLRINMLKEWKAKAIQQLKFLFSKLRLAVPLTEYQSIQSENEILKQKNADYIDRNSKLEQKAAKLQTTVREQMEAEERLKTLQEIKEDLENEYEVIRKRLEQVDPAYKWENAVFNKIVATLKRYRVSPQQAFEEFDRNKDGKLTREEFLNGLELLKVSDLSNQELDVLIGSIDVDSDGYIKYKEFVRKLSRHGVKSRTSEEQIIYLIVESLRRTGIRSLSKAFELFDKERRGSLSREDFKDVFKNMKLRIEEGDVEKFIDHFWKDKKAGIDYYEFLRIFSRYQVKLDEDENQRKTGYDRIPDEVLRLKKRIFQEMDAAFKKSGKTLKNLFEKIDIDNSNKIEIEEFKTMFKAMEVPLNDKEVRDIFNSIDFDWSGKITYPEFISDFEKTLRTNITDLIQEEKDRVEAERQGLSTAAYQANKVSVGYSQQNTLQAYPTSMTGGISMGRQQQDVQLQTKIDILEARLKQTGRKMETSMRVLNHAQQSQLETQQQYDQLEKKWNDLTEQYLLEKQRIRMMEEELKLSIRKDEAIKLKQLTESLQTECVEAKAAMTTYKNMTEVIADQVRGLKLAMERRKDENENLVNAVREISSQSEDQKRLGKLYYLIMLSRWQEAAVNKKYDMILTENRDLRRDLMNSEQNYQNKEYEHHEAENIIQDRQLQIEKLRKQIADSKNIFLTLEKAEELNNIIKEVADEKSDLEEQYFLIRTKYRSTQLLMDEAVVKSEHAQELLEFMQKSKQSEISDRMIELSSKLQNIRLNEMRAMREGSEQKEKNTYLSRLLRTQNDQLRKLEEKAAEFESKMHRREEEFRKADNDRMRRFFGARFDDIPGALQGGEYDNGGGFSRKGAGGFRDNDQFNNFKSPQSATSGRRGMSAGPDKVFSEHEMYQEPEYIRRQQSQQNIQNDPKLLEGKVKRLELELQNALEQIRGKDSVIGKFKDWQIADKYLGEDEVLREAIEKQRGKANQVHEQESKEMADAAAQMVKTMQEMLDQKNEQLKSKEEMIDRLRKQMMEQREQDGLQIAGLQGQLSLAAGTTLSKLQQIVIQSEHQPNGYLRHGSRYDQLTREELSRTLDEKDEVIHRLQSQIQGTEKSVKHLQERNKTLIDQVGDLEYELRQEKEHIELKAKVKELERIKRELKEKDKLNASLKAAVDKLRDEMQTFAIQNSNITEEQKMKKLNDGMLNKEHKDELKKLNNKLEMIKSSRDQRAEELKQANIKIQKHQEVEKKLFLDLDEAQKALRQTRDNRDEIVKERQRLLIELNNIKGKIQIGGGLGSSNGPTYEQLQARNKELENDIIILQCQQKTVVVYNKETGCFEYIGEPIYLNHERELSDIDEFLASMRAWLKRNERLTIKSVFEGMDKENFGELSEAKFEQAMLKVGVKLRQNEKKLIKEVLNPRGIGFIRYRPLVRELQGIPQLDFIIKEIIKLAKLVEIRDLSEREFKSLIDPKHEESMNLTQLIDSFTQVNNDQFSMTKEETEYLFKHITKSVRTIGVSISIDRLTEKVFTAVDALLIEKTKDAISKQKRTFQEIFQRHDANHDNFLDYMELENLLLECQLALKPHSLERLQALFDPGRRQSKISYNTFRFYISGEVSSHSAPQQQSSLVQRSYDYEPSLDRATLSEETSLEELNICRSGARKILAHFSIQQNSNMQQKSLLELMNQKDLYQEGIISRDEVFHIIQESKVSELTGAELNLLVKYMDKGTKGYISIINMMDKMYELAIESKQEVMLRNFAMNAKRQGINLKQELFRYDTTRNGRLDKKTFTKAMNQLPVTLTDEGIDILFQAGESPDFRGALDIKIFIDKVAMALKQKPLPNFQPPQQKSQTQSKVGQSAKGQSGGAFETWELEKKYKTKLTALQQQIEESKKETQAVEKQAKHWQEMANKLEKEKNGLQARLVDLNAKPPKAAKEESQGQAQLENMQQLKDKVYYLQEENTKLEKNIQVELKAEIGRLNRENEKLGERLRHYQEETKKNEYQINRLIGKPMDNIERREESELWREKKIQELEKELDESSKRESDISEQLFKCEEKLLDLKFQKETFDLQYARLQKRITDLEQYKLASSKYSAVLKHKEDEESRNIEENSNTLANLNGGPSNTKKLQDTVKLRSKSSKSIGELEMLVESLKRVIEKQKAENEVLKKQIDQSEKHQEKLKSEKQLRQKIEALSQEVHSYEMKDVNMDEKERTVRKLIEANRMLTQDLAKEAERYKLLENKYKEILVKYNVLAKENAKNTEMLFNMNTGGNIHNYDKFLTQNESEKKQKPMRDSSQGAAHKTNNYYDREFEDVF